ncbi:hypothetical protein ACHAQH_006776 [Verticillium albo-atrum]
MDVDDDEDFYSPEPTEATEKTTAKLEEASASPTPAPKEEPKTELEEGEEEDEGGAMDEDDSDSDIDIITERKDGTKAAPPTQSRYSDIRNIPQRTASSDIAVKPAAPAAPSTKSPAPKFESPAIALAVPSADKVAAAASSSKIDVNGNPIHAASGKHITAVNIDEDLGENEKPWRKPGTDISDYFNYGFDEFTWALYAAKQEAVRGEFNGDLMMAGNNKMMDDFSKMMMMGGGMGMPGGAQGAQGQAGMAGMGGMEGMPPEMQQMMQQMMSSGMDPSQMDPAAMSAMFSGMQGQGNAGTQGAQGQNFGQGFGGNQGQYGGYDQQAAMGGVNRGGFGPRGRGRRW